MSKKLDYEISEGMYRILSDGLMESNRDLYYLAFLLTGKEETALDCIKDCISTGLLSSRKIQSVPPVKPWFYHELVAFCRKKSDQKDPEIPKEYKGPLFRKLYSLGFEDRAVFALYYFEDFGIDRIANIVRMRGEDVKKSILRSSEEVGVAGKSNKKNEETITSLYKVYRSPRIPNGYSRELTEVIEKEKELNKQYFLRDRGPRIFRIIFVFAFLALITFLLFGGGLDHILGR